jgi:cell division protein FtsL
MISLQLIIMFAMMFDVSSVSVNIKNEQVSKSITECLFFISQQQEKTADSQSISSGYYEAAEFTLSKI